MERLEKGKMKITKSQNHTIAKSRTDFVRFKLRAGAPDFVAIGGARFSGSWRRTEEPFECTRGEWKVFVQRTGWFEEIEGSGDPGSARGPGKAGG